MFPELGLHDTPAQIYKGGPQRNSSSLNDLTSKRLITLFSVLRSHIKKIKIKGRVLLSVHSREGTAVTRRITDLGLRQMESRGLNPFWCLALDISRHRLCCLQCGFCAHTFSSLYQIALTFLSTHLRFNLSWLSVLNDFQLSSCPCNLHPSPPSLPARRLPCKDCRRPAP